ncbi:MAG: CarD family transcriptional regulator [Bryobacteraceae bacterium]|nr:CarD family transcriptional regulator [Bryobacteraceae bacterium]MCX7605168.1 CarD family transcriptional regulator [Bryobacteraceae bacterium]
MTFQIGEKVVYPNHGVGTIENISSRTFGNQTEKFYLLRLSATNMTVMVPFSHVEQVGLRKVTRNGDISKVLNYLANAPSKTCQDWKDRFKENSAKMQSGSLMEVAEVLKCLVEIQAQKPLSFREKKMLERARLMLVSELATSKGVSEKDAAELLARALAKANLKFPEPL